MSERPVPKVGQEWKKESKVRGRPSSSHIRIIWVSQGKTQVEVETLEGEKWIRRRVMFANRLNNAARGYRLVKDVDTTSKPGA